ncbi:MAG TPA: flippase [Bryobacteraceae bacterium]
MQISIQRLRQLARHRLVKNTAALFVVQVTTYAAPLIVLPYLSRVLSTGHFGLITYANAFTYYFLTLVDYGFNLTATRQIAIHRDEPEQISRIYSSVMAARAFLAVLGFAIMTAVVLSVPKLRPNYDLFCISYLAVLGDLLFPLFLFEGLQIMENLVWRDLLGKFLALSLIFAFVHRDSQYLWAAGFQAGALAFAGIIGFCTVPFLTPARLVFPSLREIAAALREGFPVFLSMAALSISAVTDIFILGLRSTATDVAYYMAVFRIIIAARILVNPVSTAIYPHISRMAAHSREGAVLFLKKFTPLLAAPFFLGSLILCAGAPWIVPLFYGAKYAPATVLMQIMAFIPFLYALQNCYSTFYMLAFGYEKQWSRIIIVTTIINFALLIPLIFAIWPPEALAITSLSMNALVAAVEYVFYRRTAMDSVQPIAA